MIETMRRLLLFETLSDEQLQWLAEHASEVTFTAGELIFSEGKPADALWVLIAGEWRLSRQIGGFETPLVTTAQPGTWGGGMPVAGGIHQISARATRPSRMLRIPDAAVKHMLDSGFPITRHLLAGITIGARRLEALQSEHEKLTALGKLAAGLAHELNNPAAAARRAGAGLRQVLRDQQDAVLALVPADVAERWRARLESLGDEIAAAIKAAQPGSPLERSEREDAIAAWLDDHEVPEGYDAAPTLVDAGLDVDWLERLAEHAPPEALPDLIRWVVVTAMGLLLGDQLEHSTTRISELIGAVKSYSYMDEAPLQEVDVHEGLENTLMMLGHEIKGGIVVIREYDRGLPHITAYGSELNQVWTNLIDNAIDALGGRGHLTIRTALDCDNVLVEIADDGPGIPAEVVPHIFEPFFTTKGVGEGTGLGLEIAYRIVVERHHGNIQVASQPGNTCFQVRLPIRSSS